MPVTSLVCPHCEKPVEIQVTSVTRSRPCPECGELLMLQVSEKNSKTKRKALLVASTSPTDLIPKPEMGPAYEPQMLPGAAFDRMRLDPEVQHFRKRLTVGVSLVLLLVFSVVIMDLTGVLQFRRTKAKIHDQVVDYAEPRTDQSKTVLETLGEDTEKAPVPHPEEPKVEPGKLLFKTVANPTPAGPTGIGTSAGRKGVAGGGASELAAKSEVAKAVLVKFLEASNLKERLETVLDRREVEPVMKTYYQTHPDGPITYEKIQPVVGSTSGLMEFRVVFSGMEHTAYLVANADDYLVDWPSFVTWSELSWKELRAQRPTSPVLMRVAVTPAFHFEAQFADPHWLVCVTLVPADDPKAEKIYGYVQRDTAMGRELEYWMKMANKKATQMTVRLRYPQESVTDDQVWITELLASSWLVTPGKLSAQKNR